MYNNMRSMNLVNAIVRSDSIFNILLIETFNYNNIYDYTSSDCPAYREVPGEFARVLQILKIKFEIICN